MPPIGGMLGENILIPQISLDKRLPVIRCAGIQVFSGSDFLMNDFGQTRFFFHVYLFYGMQN